MATISGLYLEPKYTLDVKKSNTEANITINGIV